MEKGYRGEKDQERGEEGRGGASRVSPPAMAAQGDVVVDGEAMKAASPNCSICMEPWICNGAHRVCCIPCGHVYGRSCLEKWLGRSIAAHRDTGVVAKCPQCGEMFEGHQINNLYAPNNIWGGCCEKHTNEIEEYYESQCEKIYKIIASMDAKHLRRSERMESRIAEQGKAANETAALVKSMKRRVEALGRFVKSDLETMKDQMKKMATQDKATAMDLIEFMELNLAKLPDHLSGLMEQDLAKPPGHDQPAC